MISQAARELAHGVADSIDFLARHTTGNVNRKDDGDRTRSAGDFLNVERRDWPLDAVLEQLEILLFQIANQTALDVRYRDVHRNEIGVYLDDILRLRIGRQGAARALLAGR